MVKMKKYLNWIEISASALNNNIASLSKLANGKLLAVSVKANAYGHGINEIINILKDNPKVHYVTVHSLDEAIACRQAGWEKNILLLGPLLLEETESVFEYGLEPVIYNGQFLDALGKKGDKLKKSVRTHIKLETGTNRQGVDEKELPAIAEIYHKYSSLQKPYGAYTHFANIEDTTNHDYAQYQLNRFENILKQMHTFKIKPEIRHTASSAATILFKNTHFEMVRPGISVYGYWPSKETYLSYRLEGGENNLFIPVLSWKTRVTQIKDIPPDNFIGYGCTYKTTSKTKLGIIPLGYYDGFTRNLSNNAYILINGKRAPVRGRVCMNIFMVDITDIKGVKLYNEAIIMGKSGSEILTADSLAGWANTINYEILARLAPSVPRTIIG